MTRAEADRNWKRKLEGRRFSEFRQAKCVRTLVNAPRPFRTVCLVISCRLHDKRLCTVRVIVAFNFTRQSPPHDAIKPLTIPRNRWTTGVSRRSMNLDLSSFQSDVVRHL